MSEKKKVPWQELDDVERMKYEIADELGLLDKVLNSGWKTLTAKETGKIGGIVTKRRRQQNEKQSEM